MQRKKARRRDRGVSFRARKAWEVVTTTLALITAIYLILNTIGPTRLLLERYVVKLNMEILAAFVAIMLEVAIISVYQLGREVRKLNSRIESASNNEIFTDIGSVIRHVQSRSHKLHRRDRRLEVLGLTLNTAWPQLITWLISSRTSHWRIKLYCLDPDFLRSCAELPDHWADEAERSRGRINRTLQNEEHAIQEQQMQLSVEYYACVPIVHGFRCGNGDVYISYLQWSPSGAPRPFEFYELIPHDDNTERADYYRVLFDNWMERAGVKAVASSPEPTSGTLPG
jgi:hypothetical protein